MYGAALLAGLMLGAIAVGRWRGFSFTRIALAVLGAITAGAVGAAPGTYLSVGGLAALASGGGGDIMVLPLVLLAAGGAGGALAGMLAADRLMSSWRPPPWAWLAALGGLSVGVATYFVALFLDQNTGREVTVLLLGPPSAAAAMVAAYAVAAESARRSPNATGLGVQSKPSHGEQAREGGSRTCGEGDYQR